MKKAALFLFLLVSIGEILSYFVEVTWLHHLCKPFIMIFLGVYYASSVSIPLTSRVVLAAIFFSFAGDTLLMYDHLHEVYFMVGLGSFLLAHIFYTVAYKQHRSPGVREQQIHGVQRIRMALPVVLAGTGLIVVLYPHLGGLKFPVIVYAFVLVIMVLNALFRYRYTTDQSFWRVFIGAVLFLVSDTLLAINKFIEPIAYSGVIIMILYITAQFLIIEGLIRHVKSASAQKI